MAMDVEVLKKMAVRYRRDLHKIPEIGFLVYRTGEYIRNVLSVYDCKIEPIAKTGLTVFWDFGKKDTVCFRSDMDALPIEEQSGAPYASTIPGAMHACGHDGHMANLLAFSAVVNDWKKNGEKLPHNILMIFQPAEEIIDGAKTICQTDVFSRYHVIAIYGLHLWPFLAKGEISTKPGVMMAKSMSLFVDVEGVSAHCGKPEDGRDALAAACDFVTHVYAFKENHISERSILKFGKMTSGTVRNIISNHTRLEGTVRALSNETYDKIELAVRHYARHMGTKYGVKFIVDTSKNHPAVVNNAELYAKVKSQLVKNHLNYVELRRPSMIAEDFSVFEEYVPGIFFFLGTGTNIALHSAHFDFDDSVLIEGVKLFMTLAKAKI